MHKNANRSKPSFLRNIVTYSFYFMLLVNYYDLRCKFVASARCILFFSPTIACLIAVSIVGCNDFRVKDFVLFFGAFVCARCSWSFFAVCARLLFVRTIRSSFCLMCVLLAQQISESQSHAKALAFTHTLRLFYFIIIVKSP